MSLVILERTERQESETMTPMEGEKREFIRVPFATEVEVQAGDRTIGSTSEIDISLNGLRLSTDRDVPPAGTPCWARIVLRAFEERVVIQAKGTVSRTGPGSLAIEFTELDLDSYHHLRQLILNNAADPERADREFAAHWGIRRSGR
jgi:PilZ domain-containing protein